MGFLRNDRRLGANLRRVPRGIGLTPLDFDTSAIQDFGVTYPSPIDVPLTTDSGPVVSDTPQPGDIISDPIAPPAANVTPTTTVVTDTSGGTVAMPTTTAATTPTADPSSGDVILSDTDQATVIQHADGSQTITYKNQPIVDPECVNLTTADINAGKVCQYNVGVPGKADYFEYRYIPTERWTGQVQSAGDLLANMNYAASLNAQFPDSAVWMIYFNNPSWHVDGSLAAAGNDPSRLRSILASLPPDYLPKYIGPTETSGGASMYIVDPTTGDQIDVTSGITPDQQAAVDEAIYGPVDQRSPGQPGYVPPVYSGPPIDETGSIINQPPPSYPPSYPPTMQPPTGGGGISPTINVPEIPAGEKTGTGMLMVAGLAALFLLRRKR